MKKLGSFIFLLLIFCHGDLRAELNGVWVIDAERTSQFFKENSMVDSGRNNLINCISKNYSIKIDVEEIRLTSKSHTCDLPKGNSVFIGYELNKNYTVLFENKDVTALKIVSDDGDLLEVLYNVEVDSFWIYFPGDPPDYQSHDRVYYKRIKN